MPPKKAAAGKKKESNADGGGELTPEEKAKMFMLTCQSLQIQLCTSQKSNFICVRSCLINLLTLSAERSEEASKAMAAKREYQGRIEQISRDFEEEQRQTLEITQDMTRQYKGMQEELLSRVEQAALLLAIHCLWLLFRTDKQTGADDPGPERQAR